DARGTAGVCSGYHLPLRMEPATARVGAAADWTTPRVRTRAMGQETELGRLREPFAAEDIEWRVQTAGEKNGRPWARVLAYVTNRAIMDRLDEVVGPADWQNGYRGGAAGGGVCGLSVLVARGGGAAGGGAKWGGAGDRDG